MRQVLPQEQVRGQAAADLMGHQGANASEPEAAFLILHAKLQYN